jgi:hypothetical protein
MPPPPVPTLLQNESIAGNVSRMKEPRFSCIVHRKIWGYPHALLGKRELWVSGWNRGCIDTGALGVQQVQCTLAKAAGRPAGFRSLKTLL